MLPQLGYPMFSINPNNPTQQLVKILKKLLKIQQRRSTISFSDRNIHCGEVIDRQT